MVGKTLGHYEILEPLGSGGMGEVYRARDTRLDRDVAIKVLPEDFATDPDRLARFEREAKLLAALNHPNIAAIYGLEDEGEISFLAMELAEGQTLAQRLSDGAIAVDEALKIALQVAEALEAAHERGIVHRDLKPANIQVATEGSAARQVKVLDFGLAKAFEPDGTSQEISPELSASPTMAAATRTGVIMGTAAYMSPEQARGKAVDKRTDIWAFGCVVFETLTGKRAFEGETVTDILAAIVHQEPQWEALPPETPLRIRDLLRRCLEKQADERLRDVGECRIAVKEYRADPEGEKRRALASAGTTTARSISWKLAAAMAVASALLAAYGVWVTIPSPPESLIRRFQIDYPPDATFTFASTLGVAISPDGSSVVFNADRQLWRRAIGDFVATPIGGTEEGRAPFFSPDGQQLGFWGGDGQIKSVPIAGGAPVSLGRASGYASGTDWADDGYIYFGRGAGGIRRVSEDSGDPVVLVQMEDGEEAYGPQLLPGGEWLLFTLKSGPGSWNDASVVAQPVSGGARQVLVDRGTDGRYVPTGHIVYFLEGTLFAVPFDADSMEITGGPKSIVEGVQQGTGATGASQYAFSDRGGLVYMPSAATPGRGLSWFDRDGNEEPIAAEPRRYYAAQVSPGGEAVAIDVLDPENRDIGVLDLNRGTMTPLTHEPGDDSYPVWDFDGSRIFMGSDGDGTTRNLFWIAADGTGQPVRLTTSANLQVPLDISPDGSQLVFLERRDIWVLSLEDEPLEPEPLIVTEFSERNANLSPDGHWIAYDSDVSGSTEVYVRPFPNVNANRWKISEGGGDAPVWSPESREIFYWRQGEGTADLMVVPVETDPSFSPGRGTVLFSATGVYWGGLARTYDIAPDGQRFFVVMEGPAGEETRPRLNVVLNWFEELKRLVPTGR